MITGVNHITLAVKGLFLGFALFWLRCIRTVMVLDIGEDPVSDEVGNRTPFLGGIFLDEALKFLFKPDIDQNLHTSLLTNLEKKGNKMLTFV